LPEALDGAVRSVVAGSSVVLDFTVRGERRPLPPLVETTALRIGREAVLNALKHADAHKVDVHLEYGARFLGVQIRDDGHGMTPHRPAGAASEGRFGIAGMRERAHRAGGTIEITSEPGRGSTVRASLPTDSSSAGGRACHGRQRSRRRCGLSSWQQRSPKHWLT
jgi:signal transduction histidine kinase